MADEKEIIQAKAVYETLCGMLDEKNLKYQKHEEEMIATFGIRGEDLPIDILFKVDADRQLVTVFSPISVTVPEDRRVELVFAVSIINRIISDGSFDYDITQGKIIFRAAHSYMDSVISKEVYSYMLNLTASLVEEYNDKILMLSKGMMTLGQFIESMKD